MRIYKHRHQISHEEHGLIVRGIKLAYASFPPPAEIILPRYKLRLKLCQAHVQLR